MTRRPFALILIDVRVWAAIGGCAREITDDAACPESHDVRGRDWKGVGCNAECEASVKRLTRLGLHVIVIGVALVLLGACAQQGQPTASATHTLLAVTTVVPTPTPLPSPPPLVKPAGEPLTPTLTFGGPGASAADLAIQAIHGETGVYTLTVRNLGPDLATGIVLIDVLPSGVTPLWIEPAQPVCGRQQRGIDCDLGDLQAGDAATVTLDLSVGGSEGLITSTEPAGVIVTLSVPVCAIEQDFGSPQVTCRLSKLQPGAEAQVHIGLAVDSPLVGEFVHTATVTADELDPDGSNNQATFTMEFDPAGPVVAAGAPTPADLVLHADGPASATAGQPFTYTYTIANRGAVDATGVWFQDIVPSDLNLVSYAPGPPRCEQHGDALTCTLRDPDGGEAVTFTVLITGHGEQPMQMGLDVLMPGWPVCGVIKERTWLQVVQCELGELAPGQEIQVQLAFVAIGVAERMTANTATIHANVADLNRVDITSTVTITIQAGTEPSGP